MEDGAAMDQSGDESAGAADVSAMIGKLGAGERLFVLGAALIVIDYLLFEFILKEYSFFTGTTLVAAFALLAVWVKNQRPSAAWPVPYGWLVGLLGFAAAVLGIIELLADLRLGILDDAGDVIGGLLLYVGAFLMAWGARQAKTTG